MQYAQGTQRDWNALMRAVLLIGLTIYLVKLIMSGQITQYVHPKFTWFTASAGIGFLLMAGGQLARGLRGVSGHGSRLRSRLYLAVILILGMGFIFQPHTFGADLAAKQGMNLTNRTSSQAVAVHTATVPQQSQTPAPSTETPQPPTVAEGPPAEPTPPKSTPEGTTPTAPDTPKAGQPLKNNKVEATGETIVITSENFFGWMNELYGDPKAYVNRPIVMEGFTFYPPDTDEDEFAVTRLVVTCHVAHAAPDGLLAYLPDQSRPQEDTWHRVEGVLEPFIYQATPTLRIRIEQMTPIQQPADPYIYP